MPTLDWIGKAAVVNHHQEVLTRLLHCDSALSAGDPDAGNLLVEGDNLEALKALLPYYAGQVKCIYIDPPYNTGNEGWVYNDNVNSPEIRAWLTKIVGKEGEDFSRHDKWLCMMYPRLRLLRDFLRDDGIIMASIDDNEITNLRFLMDTIFGGGNFITQLTWEKGRKNDARLFSSGHDYVIVYARRKLSLAGQVWRTAKAGIFEIAGEYLRLVAEKGTDWQAVSAGLATFYKTLPKDHPAKKYQRAKFADKRGVWRDNNISWHGGGGPKYDIIHPVTGRPCKVPSDGWRFVEETMLKKIEDGYVIFRENHSKPPIYKSYIYLANPTEVDTEEVDLEGQREVMSSVFYRHTQPSNDLQKDIFGEKVFPNPKDHEILEKLIRYVTADDRNCIVLDSFAGSGSTGHAVLALNAADGGQRRFILAELNEEIARTITAIRLASAVDGYARNEHGGDGEFVHGLGGGFRYCILGKPLFDEWGCISEGVTFGDLAAFVFFSDTGSPIPANATSGTSLLGTFDGRAVHLLWSPESAGVASAAAGNVLTLEVLAALPAPSPDFTGPATVYAEGCTVSPERLAAARASFRQIPYQVVGQ
ncbi:MAG TPA: site-specific DNA-methyltransferase [Allosphingosinicella sp.]|nr:site-specific DNA-methyltransferase [Allosphingosinicella sp.]